MNGEFPEFASERLNVDYYGADFPVELLVTRMRHNDFIIPGFQREYVWKELEASRFIESLLLGLPTPALFLAKDKYSQRYIVIDGQQRLRTLEYFYDGRFPDGKEFRLKGVAPHWEGLTFADLPPADRRMLSNSIIHCIIISDSYDPVGIFYIFERLNTTGSPLTAQEVRNAIYHGPFSQLLQQLANHDTWRKIFNKHDKRADAQELILRFFALHFNLDEYRGSLVDFLNEFMLWNKELDKISGDQLESLFISTISFLSDCVGELVFKHKKQFDRVLYEVMMLIAAREFSDGLDCKRFKTFHARLVSDEEFWSIARSAHNSRKNLLLRLDYSYNLYQNTRS